MKSQNAGILIISCVFPPEPVVSAQISKDISIEITSLGYMVTVLCPLPSRPAGFDFGNISNIDEYYKNEIPGVEVVSLKSKVAPQSKLYSRIFESYSFGIAVAEYLKKNFRRYRLVYINSWPIISQYIIASACKKLKVPYITHIQDIYPESLSNKLVSPLKEALAAIFLPLDKYHLRNAKTVVAISENMKEYLRLSRGLRDENMTVIYNWQDENRFIMQNNAKAANSNFTFMYLGNIGPVAGVESVIRAFHIAMLTNCRLIIAGDGSHKRKCIELVCSLKMNNVFFEEVPEGDVAKVQQQTDVLLLPVIQGGALSSIPSKLPAYMFSAKPIIATLDEDSDTAKAIIEAGCGWVGPAEDEPWLARQMETTHRMDHRLLCEIGQKGYHFGIKHFSKKANLAKLLKIICDE